MVALTRRHLAALFVGVVVLAGLGYAGYEYATSKSYLVAAIFPTNLDDDPGDELIEVDATPFEVEFSYGRAFEPDTGETLWTNRVFPKRAPVRDDKNAHAFVRIDERLFTVPYGFDTKHIAAIDLETGERDWNRTLPSDSALRVRLHRQRGRLVAIYPRKNSEHAAFGVADPTTGEWRRTYRLDNFHARTSHVAFRGNWALVSSTSATYRGTLHALHLDADRHRTWDRAIGLPVVSPDGTVFFAGDRNPEDDGSRREREVIYRLADPAGEPEPLEVDGTVVDLSDADRLVGWHEGRILMNARSESRLRTIPVADGASGFEYDYGKDFLRGGNCYASATHGCTLDNRYLPLKVDKTSSDSNPSQLVVFDLRAGEPSWRSSPTNALTYWFDHDNQDAGEHFIITPQFETGAEGDSKGSGTTATAILVMDARTGEFRRAVLVADRSGTPVTNWGDEVVAHPDRATNDRFYGTAGSVSWALDLESMELVHGPGLELRDTSDFFERHFGDLPGLD